MTDALTSLAWLGPWASPWTWGAVGALMGSFLNVVALRTSQGQDYVHERSACPHCGHVLGARELVPVASWLWQRGRCRSCGRGISLRYPLVELGTGALLATGALAAGITGMGWSELLGLQALLVGAMACALIDHDTQSIPDGLSIPGTVLAIVGAGLLGAPLAARLLGTELAGVSLSGWDAVKGALIGMGLVGAADTLGSWAMRRGQERRWPELPLGYQQISLGLAVGAVSMLTGLGGWAGALLAAAACMASGLINLSSGRVRPVPERWTLGAALLAVLAGWLITARGVTLPGLDLSPVLLGQGPVTALYSAVAIATGAVMGAGAAGWVTALWWWADDLRHPQAHTPHLEGAAESQPATAAHTEGEGDAEGDPVTMGFGDAKMLAAIGAFAGPAAPGIVLALACMSGAVWGALRLGITGERVLRFGPWLLFGLAAVLVFGRAIARSMGLVGP